MPGDAVDLPPFEPRFVDSPGMGTHYEDGRVHGAVDVFDSPGGGKQIVISEWSCDFRDRGCSAQALAWFRQQGFTAIVANGVGELDESMVGDVATYYWAHMHKKGLVDVLLDDGGRQLSVDAGDGLGYAYSGQ